MSTNQNNAQQGLEKLLKTSTCAGPFCAAGTIQGCSIPKIFIVGDNGPPLQLPLSNEDVERIKAKGERAAVGLEDCEIINLDVRTTWQLKPDKLSIMDEQEAVSQAVKAVSEKLNMADDYTVKATLYKLLLYEPGCFFKKHRDNEDLNGMFGTLCLELPSVYEGAALSVWSPLLPNESKVFAFDKVNGMHYTSFYADCYHEVSELKKGHRVALIYHLTAQPKQPSDLHLAPVPPQPANVKVAMEIAQLMALFVHETDKDYPLLYGWKKEALGKPNKFAIVLSHRYTPQGLTDNGLNALKGSDRAIAELLRAAAFYAGDEGPTFDAALSLAVVWDHGELSPQGVESPTAYGVLDHGFRTTGPLLSLFDGSPIPFNMGPPVKGDRIEDFVDQHDGADWGPDPEELQAQGLDPRSYGRPPMNAFGNHALPIYSHELLFGSEEAKKAVYDELYEPPNFLVKDSPKEVEFLGNGMPYPGRSYTRAVILLWPKTNRSAVEMQSKGGRSKKPKAGTGSNKKRRQS